MSYYWDIIRWTGSDTFHGSGCLVQTETEEAVIYAAAEKTKETRQKLKFQQKHHQVFLHVLAPISF